MDMRKVTREVRLTKWAEIIREQKASGQSIHAWCAANDVDKQRYYYWQRQLRESACENLALQPEALALPVPTFTEVRVPLETTTAGTITVRMGDRVVEIAGDASVSAIETVMRMLLGRC
jgi:transposase-like protein